jgi:hypothetical protein
MVPFWIFEFYRPFPTTNLCGLLHFRKRPVFTTQCPCWVQRFRNAPPSGYTDNAAESLSTMGNGQSKADMDHSGDSKRVHTGSGSGGKTALRAKHWRASRKSAAMGDCNTHCQGITRDYFGKQLCAGNRVSRLRKVDMCSRVLCHASWFEAENRTLLRKDRGLVARKQ